MISKLVLLTISASLLTGCGDNTPKCNSDDAKSLVVDISKKKSRNNLTKSGTHRWQGWCLRMQITFN